MRQQGVRIPENQSTEQAPSNTLVGMVKGEPWLICFGDSSGKRQEVVVYRFGDRWYLPGRTVDIVAQWVRDMKPLSSWLSKQLDDHYDRQTKGVNIPSKEEIDVLGQELVKEGTI